MKFNLYQLSIENGHISFVKTKATMPKLNETLIEIEKQIIQEFLKKQKDKIGIESLGNEIRYNKTLQAIFNRSIENSFMLVKLTENRRSFLRVFIDYISAYLDCEIYFFIFEDSFGQKSKLVDPTFIRIKDVEEELNKLFQISIPKFNVSKIFFIEMLAFDDYIIEEIIENKRYSKLIKYDAN